MNLTDDWVAYFMIGLIIILFAGEPDIADAIVYWISGGGLK